MCFIKVLFLRDTVSRVHYNIHMLVNALLIQSLKSKVNPNGRAVHWDLNDYSDV